MSLGSGRCDHARLAFHIARLHRAVAGDRWRRRLRVLVNLCFVRFKRVTGQLGNLFRQGKCFPAIRHGLGSHLQSGRQGDA